MQIIGIESAYAVAIAVIRLVAPGPAVAMHTAGLPDMPIRFFSGADDPCAISKEKLGEAMAVLKKAGYRDVRCRRYAGMRHDILHEREKHLVYRDILDFIGA